MCDDVSPQTGPQTRRSPWAASTSLTLLVIQNSVSLILLHKIQQPSLDDRNRYEPLTAVILSETLKLIVCVILLGFDQTPPMARTSRIRRIAANFLDDHFKAAAPAMLYTVAVVLQSVGARNLDGTSFVVLSQLKLILTPIFAVVVLRQSLTLLQWLCLFTIAVGIILVQTAASSTVTFDSKYGQDIRIGTLSMLVSGTCVALAGILMESILKVPNRFIARNAQLAAYACVCAGLSLVARSIVTTTATTTTPTSPFRNGIASFLEGYHALVWVFVFLQAAGGLIVAWSVRASNTVAKNYAQAVGFIIASIGPSLLSPHETSYRIYTGVGLVTAGLLVSLGGSRKSVPTVPNHITCKDVEKLTEPQT